MAAKKRKNSREFVMSAGATIKFLGQLESPDGVIDNVEMD
jgi:hypothetical protein